MIEKERNLYEQRVERFIGRIKNSIYEDATELQAAYCRFEPMVPFEDRLQGQYQPISKGEAWGKNWQRAWFRIQGTIPGDWKGRHVCARINLGAEGLVYDAAGTPLLSLSFHSIWAGTDFRRDRIHITPKARGGEALEYWIEATAAQLFGLALAADRGDQAPEHDGLYEARIQDCSLAVFREDIWHLYLDCFVLWDLLKKLADRSVRRARLLRGLNEVINAYGDDPPGVKHCRKLLETFLHKPAHASDLNTVAVGHAHIDTAWLWPIDETIRKCARTFASQLALIEKYPGYVFGASQAQHYAFVKENYPAIYRRIKEKVNAGHWEVQGGMWVEADCNLITGESMVRQILYGKNFFKKEFGVEVKNLWLPDVFGYSAALPQILKKSGIDYFLTQKLSWNQFNRFPHHTFIWRGIDGSEVLAHFPPEDNYNSDLRPSALIHAQENFDEKDRLDEFLTLFGIGDGGGGATEEMIECGRRQVNLEGCPRVRFGPAQALFDRLAKHKNHLQRWVGELYLEMHRGTLTTQACNKKMNRLLEHRLRAMEMLGSFLPLDVYPGRELQAMWKTVLLHQFHDIIPGSSIGRVYEDSRKAYTALMEQADRLQQRMASKILRKDDESITFFNPLSFAYTRPINLPDDWTNCSLVDAQGNAVPFQREWKAAVIKTTIPPLSFLTLRKGRQKSKTNKVDFHEAMLLENELVRYRFDASGRLVQAYDKECSREIMVRGQSGNELALYDDRPNNWDAWDIDLFYEQARQERAQLQKQEWLSHGPVRQGIRQEMVIGNSAIIQHIYLRCDSKCLDFGTEVDWQEQHKMLRVSFTVAVQAAEATFEIQFGTVKRPTHRNTSWDAAKFEVVGHRFADLSDETYGVALLNDSKYGYKILGNTLDLNLLRSPTMPDPAADRGRHHFVYSLLPHGQRFVDSGVLAEASMLNQAPLTFASSSAPDVLSPVELDNDEIILEVIKKAEHDAAHIIRLYEPKGRAAAVNVRLQQDCKAVYLCDLLENSISKLNIRDDRLTLEFDAFEIKTLKLVPENNKSGRGD